MKKITTLLFALVASIAVMATEGALSGKFSISSTEKVQFAQGNLQYQASSNTWRFAENQYDIIGSSNEKISSTYSGWIDLFGWGTSGYNNKYPYMTSTVNYDYGDGDKDINRTKYDWGINNPISNGGNKPALWRALTQEEWNYLLNSRNGGSCAHLQGPATVNGVKGYVILPDEWTQPSGVSFNYSATDFTTNKYSVSEWNKMQTNGAVFLPFAGLRNGTSYSEGMQYTTMSRQSGGDVYKQFISTLMVNNSAQRSFGMQYRYMGLAVRLVTYDPIFTITQNNIIYKGDASSSSKTLYVAGEVSDVSSATIEGEITYNGESYIVDSIANSAFRSKANLTSITLPSSIRGIGADAFWYCKKLQSVYLPSALQSIGSGAFSGCESLENIEFPSYLRTIGNAAFAGTALTQVVISGSISELGENAFANCSKLTNVRFESGDLKTIRKNTFYNCPLNDVSFSEGLEVIEEGVFANSKISMLNLPSSLTTIGTTAFVGLPINDLSIPDKVTSIGEKAFADCTSLMSVSIGKGVKRLLGTTFLNCKNINLLTLKEGLEVIEDDAFYGTQLSSLTLPNTLTSIGRLAFAETQISELVIPDKVKNIGANAFAQCAFLEKLTLGKSLESIGYRAFSRDEQIKEAILPNGLTTLGEEAFYLCTGLQKVSLGKSLSSIPKNAFADCSKLESVSIPASVKTIDQAAFIGTGITNLIIGEGVKTIGVKAFANCNKLIEIRAYALAAPSTGSNAFENVPAGINVSVPCSGIDSYTSAWSNFTNITGIIPIYAESEDDVKGSVKVTYAGDCANPVTVLMATPNEGYKFTKWSDGNTDNPRTITTAEPLNLVALFESLTGIREVNKQSTPSTKVLRNGQLFIFRGDKVYTITGQEVK